MANTKATFDSRVQVAPDKHWIWHGTRNRRGYGVFHFSGEYVLAHRFAYEKYRHKLKPDDVLVQTCDLKGCVSPHHWRIYESHQERWARKPASTSLQFCINGHPLDPANLYKSKYGRRCRECNRQAAQKYRFKQKGEQ